jgi:hypothetical protein
MMRYQVMTAATTLFLLAGCDDPKPKGTEGRDVTAPSQMSGSAAQQQGTISKETPGGSMMMQAQPSGNGQTMQQQRIGPRGEPAAGTQPGATTPKPISPVPGQQ